MTRSKDPVFGIAMRNFTKYPEMPSAAGSSTTACAWRSWATS